MRSLRMVSAGMGLLVLMALMPSGAVAQDVFRVGDRADPTESSIAMSQYAFDAFEDGSCSSCANIAVIGRSDSFPDNLAGAAAAGLNGPLLLHPPAPAGLDDRIASELERVLGFQSGEFACHSGDTNVLLLGGTAAISQAVEDDLRARNYCVERAGGSTRVETAKLVAEFVIYRGLDPDAEAPQGGVIYVATAGNAADSASASAHAAFTGNPILITSQAAVDGPLADYMFEYRPSRIILLGGTAALSDDVEQTLRDMAGNQGLVTRIAGVSRDDTAAKVAGEMWTDPSLNGGGDSTPQNAAIVNGYTADFWTWALPGAVIAARESAPMLFVQTDLLPGPTNDALVQIRPGYVVTVGPAFQVSDQTAMEAAAAGGVHGGEGK